MVIGCLVSLQGCDVRSFVKVDVPDAVVLATGAQTPVTLDKAVDVREDWIFYVESNTKRLDESILRGEQTYETINNILNIGIGLAGEATNGIPYGGILFGALTGVAGLLLPQPKFIRKKEK